MQSEEKCTPFLLGKHWLSEFPYRLEGDVVYMAFIDEDRKLNIYLKKWKCNKYSKRLQKDDFKARENGLAVLKCHPQEEGEKRAWRFSEGIFVPALTEVAMCQSLLTVGVFLVWWFYLLCVLIGRVKASIGQP